MSKAKKSTWDIRRDVQREHDATILASENETLKRVIQEMQAAKAAPPPVAAVAAPPSLRDQLNALPAGSVERVSFLLKLEPADYADLLSQVDAARGPTGEAA